MLVRMLGLLLLILNPATLLAEGTVRMELYTQAGFQVADSQKWYQMLTELGVTGLQIRGAQGREQAEIIEQGTKTNPSYLVKGFLTGRGELVVPGGRFRVSDRGKLKAWIDELQTWGTQGSPDGQPAFGLNGKQFGELKRDLAQAVAKSTEGESRPKVFRALKDQLTTEVVIASNLAEAYQADDKVTTDLRGISVGTALAYLMRPLGHVMTPERLPSGKVRLVVQSGDRVEKPWPVGFKPQKRNIELVPRSMEFLTVEIDPTPLKDVVGALQQRLEVPVLWDRNQLIKHDIDPSQIKVSFPKKRSWYNNILGNVLRQAELKHELRIDENNQPFYWVTTLKP